MERNLTKELHDYNLSKQNVKNINYIVIWLHGMDTSKQDYKLFHIHKKNILGSTLDLKNA